MESTHTAHGIISGSQTQTSTVSSAPSVKSDHSKGDPPNMAEGRSFKYADSGYASSLSSASVSSGPVLCDVCSDPVKAVKTCLTCMASYCVIHVKDHYTSPDLERHQLQDLHHHSLCQQHHRELEFYCRTDQSAICSRCLLHNHTGHDVIEQTPERAPSKSVMKEGVCPPGPIQFDSVQPDSVCLRWSPPEGAPGHHRFEVTWTGGQMRRSLKVTGVDLEVTELTPGEKYHFTVATLSQDGHQSACVGASVHTEVPPPQNLQVDLKSPTASLTWTKPAGVDQVTYLLEIFRDEEQIRTISRESCHYTITDLQAADYNVCVSSVLRNGRQSKSTSKTFLTEVPPPQDLQVDLKSPTARLTWTKPAGVDQVTYLLDIVRDKEQIHTISRDSCDYTITDLQAADYTVNVSSVLRNGRQSKPTSQTFLTEVPPPQHLQVDVWSRKASLTWTKPTGVDQVTYLLEIFRDEEQINTISTDFCHYTITDVQAADYTVSISTVLRNGRPSKPTSKTFKTARSPKFIEDLLPAVERTALLFQLSYLYLAGHSELEKMIRERALNARRLFVSSERVMFKYLCTSDDLVKSLFPMLKVDVQENRPELARTTLAKAQGWISEIITAAEEMVDGYEKENKALSETRSTIYDEGAKKQSMTAEMRGLEQGSIPSPEHLKEARHCMVRIQDILIQILRFWNHVGEMLKRMELQTFCGNELIDELQDCKEIFLESIAETEQAWRVFGQSCMKGQEMFHIQSKDAYKSLETNPSSLSEEDKQKEIADVNAKLKDLSRPYCVLVRMI